MNLLHGLTPKAVIQVANFKASPVILLSNVVTNFLLQVSGIFDSHTFWFQAKICPKGCSMYSIEPWEQYPLHQKASLSKRGRTCSFYSTLVEIWNSLMFSLKAYCCLETHKYRSMSYWISFINAHCPLETETFEKTHLEIFLLERIGNVRPISQITPVGWKITVFRWKAQSLSRFQSSFDLAPSLLPQSS